MCTLTQIALICSILIILFQGAVLYGLCVDLKRRDEQYARVGLGIGIGVDPDEAELQAALQQHQQRQQQQSV